jgi:3-oxoacyl-[acyl-carrier-protein] synthase III
MKRPKDCITMTAYITATGAFLPGDPIDNDTMESRLGLVAGKPSRFRETVLKHNGIKNRHYAIDADGRQTHLNEELAANAIEAALAERGLPFNEVGMLAVGTTIPDLVMPGFAPMVHGRLGSRGPAAPMEVLSTNGICASGAAALLHASTAVTAGRHDKAVAAASELSSVMMRSSRF